MSNVAFVGSIPQFYDRYMGPVVFAPYADDLGDRVQAGRRGGDVLETACGTGILTRRLAGVLDPAVGITATDLHEKMLAQARNNAPGDRITWRQADASALPFDAGAFGVVVCQFGMMFMPDHGATVREARRVLQPDGLFAFNVWCGHDENAFGDIAYHTIGRFFPFNRPSFYLIPFSWHDPDIIRSLLTANGFTQVAIERVTLEARAPSARDFATGLVQGNPVAHDIRESGLALAPIIDAVTTDLIREGGDAPFRSPMSALVVTARAA